MRFSRVLKLQNGSKPLNNPYMDIYCIFRLCLKKINIFLGMSCTYGKANNNDYVFNIK